MKQLIVLLNIKYIMINLSISISQYNMASSVNVAVQRCFVNLHIIVSGHLFIFYYFFTLLLWHLN